MKILGSFNTKLDEQELYEAIQKNGQGNAIMMKKHRIFLVRPMVRMIFAFAAFGLLIWFAYWQFFKAYNLLFRIIAIAYSGVTLVRCVHSLIMIIYDISYQGKFKNGYIDSINKSDLKEGRYEKFLRHSFISMGLQVALMTVNSIVSFALGNNSGTEIFLNVIGVVVNLGFLFLLYKVLDRIIDYEMDFNIFTTDQFIIYRQHGFFRTESMNIATSTIKLVRESKSGFWGYIFHYGKVSIHPEGNLNNDKAIQLFYVPSPKALTKKLNEFIERSKEGLSVSMLS